MTEVAKIKQRYLDRLEVRFFSKTISTLFEYREGIREDSSIYIVDMIAMGMLDWEIKRDKTVEDFDDLAELEEQIHDIASFILDGNNHVSEPYKTLTCYFQLMCDIDSKFHDVEGTMESFMIDDWDDVYDVFKQYKTKVGE